MKIYEKPEMLILELTDEEAMTTNPVLSSGAGGDSWTGGNTTSPGEF